MSGEIKGFQTPFGFYRLKFELTKTIVNRVVEAVTSKQVALTGREVEVSNPLLNIKNGLLEAKKILEGQASEEEKEAMRLFLDDPKVKPLGKRPSINFIIKEKLSESDQLELEIFRLYSEVEKLLNGKN